MSYYVIVPVDAYEQNIDVERNEAGNVSEVSLPVVAEFEEKSEASNALHGYGPGHTIIEIKE